MAFGNVCNNLPIDTALHPKRRESLATKLKPHKC